MTGGFGRCLFGFAIAVACVASGLLTGGRDAFAGPTSVRSESIRPDFQGCYPQPQHGLLNRPLPRLTAALREGRPVTIVTIGSSSTAGAFASSIQATYPSRLAVEMLRRFPGRSFRVINSGVNGEEVAEMLRRFELQVFSYQPDLVIWQLGTNGLLRNIDPGQFEQSVYNGLARIRGANTDVVLMDLQYAPRVEAASGRQAMLDRIEALGQAGDVPVYHRYAVMKAWATAMGADYAGMIAADGLHQTDRSYACLAADLAASIADAVRRAPVAVRRTPVAAR